MNSLGYIIQTVAIWLNFAKRQSYYILKTGNCCNTHREILNYLHKCVAGLKEVEAVEECDVVLVFCPIVSRAGTDIQAALNELNACSESKQAVFTVLHHSFNPEKIVPDSSRLIKRRNTLTVDCLFNEDVMLLKCEMNRQAQSKITKYFKQKQLFTIQHLFSRRCMCFAATMLLFGAGALLYNRSK